MGGCCFSSLRDKEVINICDGRRLGYIYDVEINICTGAVTAIIVLFDCRVFGFGKCEELVIPWDKIQCVGDDAVLVSVGPELYAKFSCKAKKDV